MRKLIYKLPGQLFLPLIFRLLLKWQAALLSLCWKIQGGCFCRRLFLVGCMALFSCSEWALASQSSGLPVRGDALTRKAWNFNLEWRPSLQWGLGTSSHIV